jgi:ATP-dependent DNA helicase DinG
MSWSDAEIQFAQTLPNYESRAQQQRLAQQIETSLAAGEHLAAQAGTGTGKSLALLVPAIDHARNTGMPVIIATATKALQDQYCVAPETRVLTADLRYIPARDVVEGMQLAGFDEERVGARRHYRTATVESAELIERPCYELTFDDGTVITSSVEHRWLVKKSMEIKWMTTEQLCVAAGKRLGSQVIRLFDTWDEDLSRTAGYLAAAFDGEGHLSQMPSRQLENGMANKLAFAQKDNEMLDEVKKGLDELSFGYREDLRPDIRAINISHRRDMVRFLGQVRPARLLPKFQIEGLGSLDMRDGVRLVAKRFVGTQVVMAIKTSTSTFIAEGLASHNCAKDLPFLQEHLGKPFTWAMLKGRSNYACRAKLADLKPGDMFGADSLLQELDSSEHSGDLDDVVTDLDPRDRSKITSSSDECPGKHDCPFSSVCFAEAAKAKAKEADVVVVNHALLMADLWVRSQFTDQDGNPVGMLPDYSAVGIDEAHELEEYATSVLGQDFGQRGLVKLATEVLNFTDDRDINSRINGAAGSLFGALDELLKKAGKNERTTALSGQDLLVLETPITTLLDALRAAWGAVNGVDVRGDDAAAARKKRLKKRVGSTGSRLSDVLLADSGDLVRWVEREERMFKGRLETSVRLCYAPLHVGPFLREHLWSNVPGMLLSATLAFNGDFSYLMGRLGIDSYRSFDAGTPFTYEKQAALFVPDNMDPSPASRSKWAAMCPVVMAKLVKAAGGRALLLFTSRTAMNQAHDAVAAELEDLGLQVLKQGDRPNKILAQEFKRDETSVLFALKSFMTGVDVQGDALRLVIIDKLPFPVPSDVIWAARCEAVDRNARNQWVDGSFPTMTVPAMALTLLQAFGRLIRTRSDEGMVAILDSRLHTKSYGRKMLKALPPARRITALSEAVGYLEGLDEE